MRVLMLAGLALLACGPSPMPAPTPGSPASALPVVPVVLSGEHRGELVPCGCTVPQLGGVAQRAGVLARRGGALVEIGNAVEEPGPQSRLKLRAFFSAAQAMGCVALVVGDRDLLLGVETLRAAAGGVSFPVLAANLRGPGADAPFPGLVRATAPGGARFAVIGLLPAGASPVDAGWVVRDPLAALPPLLAELLPGEPLLVAGTYDAATARRIAAALGLRPAVVAYGRGQSAPTPQVERAGAARLIGVGGRGRYLAALDLRSSGDPEILSVLHPGPAPPEVEAALAHYRRSVVEQDLLGRVPRVDRAAYAGSDSCRGCHAEAHATWERSRHARALESLVRVGHDRDPECVACHVVGFGEREGFQRPGDQPELDRVGCEACHGPGREHADQGGRGPIERGGGASCARCHRKDHDPHFEFDRRWPSIAH